MSAQRSTYRDSGAPGYAELARLANRIRQLSVEAVYTAGAGHIGGPLSVAEILTALYFAVANVDPDQPSAPDRDRVLLSKGHSAIALYAAMALRGYFDVDELLTFDSIDSRLQGHPDMTALPGLDMSTGSLGQGLSVGAGMALACRLTGHDYRVFVVLGDGECQEGQVWEAAHFASAEGLNNLVAVVDANGLSQWGRRLPPHEPVPHLAERWSAFGWNVVTGEGHDLKFLVDALGRSAASASGPTCVIARTVKGKGVKRFEGDYEWHSKVPTDEEFAEVMAELRDQEAARA